MWQTPCYMHTQWKLFKQKNNREMWLELRNIYLQHIFSVVM